MTILYIVGHLDPPYKRPAQAFVQGIVHAFQGYYNGSRTLGRCSSSCTSVATFADIVSLLSGSVGVSLYKRLYSRVLKSSKVVEKCYATVRRCV
jgi:hypothetical protein